MRLLLSNDDGIEAAGLNALADALDALDHEVWVVAPSTERSSQSHSLTVYDPLRVDRRGERRWAITGTPADCIYVAVHHLMREHPPDLVLSGINHGSNLGSDVHYSGTVAAAREACLRGFGAIAVSMHQPVLGATHWATATAMAARALDRLRVQPLPREVFLNLNVPNLPIDELRGLKVCRLGQRVYGPLVDERMDPRGNPYVWIGGPHLHYGEDPEADGPSVESGWATATPLSARVTCEAHLAAMQTWTDR